MFVLHLLFALDEFIDKFVGANTECVTGTKIHAKCNKPVMDASKATAFFTGSVTKNAAVAQRQSVARQKCKLVAVFGVRTHLAWVQHLLDNREFVKLGGRFPSCGPRPCQDDVAYVCDEEERDLYQQDPCIGHFP